MQLLPPEIIVPKISVPSFFRGTKTIAIRELTYDIEGHRSLAKCCHTWLIPRLKMSENQLTFLSRNGTDLGLA